MTKQQHEQYLRVISAAQKENAATIGPVGVALVATLISNIVPEDKHDSKTANTIAGMLAASLVAGIILERDNQQLTENFAKNITN